MKLTLDDIYKPWKVIFVNDNKGGGEQHNEAERQQHKYSEQQCKRTEQQCNEIKTQGK